MEYIIGVFVSLGVEWLKKNTRVSGGAVLFILALVSVAAAAVYTWLSSSGYWEAISAILITAGAFHNFIIKRFTPNA
jgi:ABC-type Mn2+/Zn2+ transport system permease subunit